MNDFLCSLKSMYRTLTAIDYDINTCLHHSICSHSYSFNWNVILSIGLVIEVKMHFFSVDISSDLLKYLKERDCIKACLSSNQHVW